MHFPGVVRWWKLSRSVYTAFPFNFVASPGEKAAIGSLVLVGAKSQSFGGLLHSPFDGRVDCRNAVELSRNLSVACFIVRLMEGWTAVMRWFCGSLG